MGNSQNREKIESIQLLRAVAAVLVILVHAINIYDGWMLKLPSGERLPSLLGNYGAINEFGASGVDLFFVISGFIMALIIDGSRNSPTVKNFTVGRFKRVVPLFWITTALYTLYCINIGVSFEWQQIVHNFTIIPLFPDYPAPVLVVGWSLAFELVFYAMVAVTLIAPRRHRMMLLIMMVACVACTGGYFMPASPVFNAIFLEFLLGLAVYIIWRKYPVAGMALPMMCCATGVAALGWTLINGFTFSASYQAVFANLSGVERSLYWALPWALIVIGSLWLEKGRDNRHACVKSRLYRAMLYLGDASYSLYLAHFFVVISIAQMPVQKGMNMDAMIIAVMAMSIGLGIIWYEKIERPLIRCLGREALQAGSKISEIGEARKPRLPV